MDRIAGSRGILHGPRRVVSLLLPGVLVLFDGPLCLVVSPSALRIDGRFSVGIDHHFHASILQSFGKLGDEELSSTVVGRRNRNERWRHESDLQEFDSLAEMVRA